MNVAPRWRKIWADLRSSKGRTALVVASIAVGLFAIGIIATMYVVIADDMRAAYTGVNAANVYVQTSLYNPDMIDHLTHVEGVRQVQGVRSFDLRVRNTKGDWQDIHLQAVKDWAALSMNRVALRGGIWPPQKDEIVLDQYKRGEVDAKIGASVTLQLPDGKSKELTLVGVVQDLTIGTFGGGGGFFEAPVQGYIHIDTLEKLAQSLPTYGNGVYATITGPGDDLAFASDVAQRLSKQIKDNNVAVLSTKSRSAYEHPNAYLVNAISGVLFVLGLLVVFLSGFLITSTLQALLGQQVQQIGIMKSVGARWLQVAGIYMMLILIFGLIALVVAAPLSSQISFWLLGFLGSKLNFILQGWRVVPQALVIQIVLALVMPQAAAWLPIWKGTRISVREALSGISSGEARHHVRQGHNAPPQKRSAGLSKVISRPMLIAIRNTFRRKGRLALTLMTLTLGGAVFIATFNVQVSMNKYIEQISQYFLSDVSVTFDRPYRISRVEEILGSVPGVAHVEGWSTARSELLLANNAAGDRVALLAPPAGSSLVKPVLMEGRWIQPGDTNAIALSELFRLHYPNLQVGDPLRLQVNGKKTDWVVVGFYRLAGKNGGFSAYASFETLSRLIGQPNQAVMFQVVSNRPHLTAAEQDQLANAIEARLKSEGMQISGMNTGAFLTDIAGSGFNILITLLLILAALTALVGSIGLAGTMSMNVMERTREIGVMRAIGAPNLVLMRMVLVEGMIIGAISYVLGALLAFPISKLLADGISLAIFDAPSTFGATPLGFILWLAMVIVLSFAASVIPARNASRLTIREVLSYE